MSGQLKVKIYLSIYCFTAQVLKQIHVFQYFLQIYVTCLEKTGCFVKSLICHNIENILHKNVCLTKFMHVLIASYTQKKLESIKTIYQ